MIAVNTLIGLLSWKPDFSWDAAMSMSPPYPELRKNQSADIRSRGENVIFITGRFRSGTTLLWNIFRSVDDCTAYYEPFNERRWFDPANRGNRIDLSHKKVSNYWHEYDGMVELGNYHTTSWTYRHLYMDSSFWNPGMKQYVDLLIKKSTKKPVLQFNRIDFRLAWFRQNYPLAKILHIYRHPRDQWCSMLRDPKCFPKNGKTSDFVMHDRFYLLPWAKELKYHFPFLDENFVEHPYQLHYYIWKISYLFGVKYVDYSIALESLIENPLENLKDLFRTLQIKQFDLNKIVDLIEKPQLRKWRQYADDAWFGYHETICETVLDEFIASSMTGSSNYHKQT